MSMFPHTITIYSLTDDLMTITKVYNITVLNGVLVDESQGTNILKSGLSSADAVTVFVPFSVNSGVKTFIPEKQYERLSGSDQLTHWTLRAGKDFFILGEIIEPGKNRQQLEGMYDGVYSITTVDTKNFGTPDMQHWQIGGQ